MQTIGLIGGMSWESSAVYYRLLNEQVRDRLGGLHSADCVLLSVDFHYVERLQAEDRWDEAGALLADAGERLARAGAAFVVLCTNTMHAVADRITALPVLHIGDATADAAVRQGLCSVALLGTRYTMEKPFYRERLESRGLQVVVPEAADRERIHRVIYESPVRRTLREPDRACVAPDGGGDRGRPRRGRRGARLHRAAVARRGGGSADPTARHDAAPCRGRGRPGAPSGWLTSAPSGVASA